MEMRLIFLIIVSVTLLGCGDDEEKNNGKHLIGAWYKFSKQERIYEEYYFDSSYTRMASLVAFDFPSVRYRIENDSIFTSINNKNNFLFRVDSRLEDQLIIFKEGKKDTLHQINLKYSPFEDSVLGFEVMREMFLNRMKNCFLLYGTEWKEDKMEGSIIETKFENF